MYNTYEELNMSRTNDGLHSLLWSDCMQILRGLGKQDFPEVKKGTNMKSSSLTTLLTLLHQCGIQYYLHKFKIKVNTFNVEIRYQRKI